MVLLVLMRWPILIILCALGGAAFVLSDRVDFDQVRSSLFSVADNANIPLRQFVEQFEPEEAATLGIPIPKAAAPAQAASAPSSKVVK